MFSQLFKEKPPVRKGRVGGGRGSKAKYIGTSCDVGLVKAMLEHASQVSYNTFASNCEWSGFAKLLGYAVRDRMGLHLSEDTNVKYYKSNFDGKVCYYALHGSTKHIFVRD